jgi:hypothetical protein
MDTLHSALLQPVMLVCEEVMSTGVGVSVSARHIVQKIVKEMEKAWTDEHFPFVAVWPALTSLHYRILSGMLSFSARSGPLSLEDVSVLPCVRRVRVARERLRNFFNDLIAHGLVVEVEGAVKGARRYHTHPSLSYRSLSSWVRSQAVAASNHAVVHTCPEKQRSCAFELDRINKLPLLACAFIYLFIYLFLYFTLFLFSFLSFFFLSFFFFFFFLDDYSYSGCTQSHSNKA